MKPLAVILSAATGFAVLVPAGHAVAVAHHLIVVPRDFTTIQAAVDSAAPGDRISVRPGTYTEELMISKDVAITGSGRGATIIKSPPTLTSYGVHLPDNRDVTAIIRVGGAAQVRMSGLTVTGPIPCGIETSGVNVYEGATLDLSDARFTGIHADPATCDADNAAGRAVVYGLPPHIVADGVHGSLAFGRITNVVVDNYQHAGISVTGPTGGDVSRVQVVGNLVRGGAVLPSFEYGIHVAAGAVAQVAGNVVLQNVCALSFCGPDPINEGQAIGIFVQSAVAGSTITRNYVAANDVGIYQVDSPACCAITHNRLARNRYFGLVIQDGDGAARDNLITGGPVGIGVVADFVDTTAVLHHDVVRAAEVAVQEIDCCGYTATAVIS